MAIEQTPQTYVLFGVFAVINYIVPYFMWVPSTDAAYETLLFFRLTAGTMCFLLIISESWPPWLHRFLPLYWYITLLFCLPFITTYMFIQSHASIFWMVNAGLTLFLLGILLHWAEFLIILFLGVFLGSLVATVHHHDAPFFIDKDDIYLFAYMCVFSTLIALIFSRKKDIQEHERLRTLNVMINNIAHEIRTPLATLLHYSSHIARSLPIYMEAYGQALKAGVPVRALPTDAKEIHQLPKKQKQIAHRALKMVDMLIQNIHGFSFNAKLAPVDINVCIQKAIAEYPFIGDAEQAKVKTDTTTHFMFAGQEILMVHVLFNLIKNALTATQSTHNGRIVITTKTTNLKNILIIEDNGVGINPKRLKSIFEPFRDFSSGSGIGLAFCKNIIQGFGGGIFCESEPGQYTRFIITLPRCSESEIQALRLPTSEAKKVPVFRKEPRNYVFIDDQSYFAEVVISSLLIPYQSCKNYDNPRQALEHINHIYRNGAPEDQLAAIVVDQDMPGLKGLELCAQIEDPLVKKIILTGEADPIEVEDAVEQGKIYACVTKSHNFIQKLEDLLLETHETSKYVLPET
ncbi:MAG: hypothetical protein A2Y14_02350 [Verrucomicrobia bacterium GWF2_51_19]|nr:MAG: hypothetical protein A2Y14_02350 [Verrucomicrobia bacterium GWF2_51_19]